MIKILIFNFLYTKIETEGGIQNVDVETNSEK